MSTDEVAEVTKYVAILRRGNYYDLNWKGTSIIFHKGCRVVIDDDIRDHLEDDSGVDYVASEDLEVTGKHKFEYRDYDGAEPIGRSLDPFKDQDDDRNLRRNAPKEPARDPAYELAEREARRAIAANRTRDRQRARA